MPAGTCAPPSAKPVAPFCNRSAPRFGRSARPVCSVLSPMGRRWWRVSIAVMALAVTGYLVVPVGTWGEMAWSLVDTVGPAATIVIATRRMPRNARPAWYLMAFGIFANGAAVVPNTIVYDVLDTQTYPTVADAFY